MLNNPELQEIRKKIDIQDNIILKALEERLTLVKKVAEIKKANNLPIRDLAREKEVIESKYKKTSLPKEFIKKLYKLIIDNSVSLEEKII